MNNPFGHQGDVFYKKVDSFEGLNLKDKIIKLDKGGTTLIEGELTGHHHQFRNPEVVDVYSIESENGIPQFAVVVKEDTEMTHYNVLTGRNTGEHNAISFPKGNYIVSGQREMSADLIIQTVID